MKITAYIVLAAATAVGSSLVSSQPSELIELHKLIRIQESNHVWIYSDQNEIALDVIHYPRYTHLPKEEQITFYSSLNARLRELLSEDNRKFMFLLTNNGHAGPGQTCGIVFLKDGTTLQEVLIREGFARFDRNWKESGKPTQTKGAVALVGALEKKLLAADNAAKNGMHGYWKIDGNSMKYYWDEELVGRRFQRPKKIPNKSEQTTPSKLSD